MKDNIWRRGRKKRIQKKYTLMLGRYYSPKEIKEWYRKRRQYEVYKS